MWVVPSHRSQQLLLCLPKPLLTAPADLMPTQAPKLLAWTLTTLLQHEWDPLSQFPRALRPDHLLLLLLFLPTLMCVGSCAPPHDQGAAAL
jgi:hypothetical protein